MKFENEVIIIGEGGFNDIGLIHSFSDCGIIPYYIHIGNLQKYPLYSNKIKKKWQVNNFDSCLKILLDFIPQTDKKSFLIPASDNLTYLIEKSDKILGGKYIFQYTLYCEGIEHLMNKEIMRVIAEKCGFKTPITTIISQGEEIPHNLKYPIITKSIKSIDGGKSDIKICYNEDQLKNHLQHCKSSNIQLQQYIKRVNEIILIGCYSPKNDELLLPGYITYNRLPIGEYGGYIKSIPDVPVDIKQKCKSFFKECQYNGMFSMEFIIDENKELYFLEVNFRNDGYSYAITASGINIPMTWCYKQINPDYPLENLKINKSINILNEFYDFSQIFLKNKYREKISFYKWIKEVLSCDAYLVYQNSDRVPIIYQFSERFLNKIKRWFSHN